MFLQYAQDHRLERQLTALYSRLMGVSALTDQPTLLEELILNRKPKRWELREFCVKVRGGGMGRGLCVQRVPLQGVIKSFISQLVIQGHTLLQEACDDARNLTHAHTHARTHRD